MWESTSGFRTPSYRVNDEQERRAWVCQVPQLMELQQAKAMANSTAHIRARQDLPDLPLPAPGTWSATLQLALPHRRSTYPAQLLLCYSDQALT